MNVRNLREMFERRATLKEEQVPEKEQEVRPKLITEPIVRLEGPQQVRTEVKFTYNDLKPPEPPNASQGGNKSLMDELNRKLERKSANLPSQTASQPHQQINISPPKGQQSPKEAKASAPEVHFVHNYQKRDHEPRQAEQRPQGAPNHAPSSYKIKLSEPELFQYPSETEPQQPHPPPSTVEARESKTSEKELNMDDILSGVDRKSSSESQLNTRYGIHQNYPSRPHQKTMFTQGTTNEGQTKNSSFSDMLDDMQVSIRRRSCLKTTLAQQAEQNKITNKFEYDQSYKCIDTKTRRISFVLDVIFGQHEFEDITSNREKPVTIMSEPIVESASRPVELTFKHTDEKSIEKQIVLEEIVKKKNEDQESNTMSSTFEGPGKAKANNELLNDLTVRLLKNSVDSSKMNLDRLSPKPPTSNESTQRSKNLLDLMFKDVFVPKQKKKQKGKQIFDDF